jgi:AcrR family transcriptional regulator
MPDVAEPSTRAVARRRSKGAKQLGRPPGSSAEDTVARLLDAAQVHFGAHGFSGARMTEIADAAGITHSSIYQYFASKRDLYRAVFDAAQADLLPQYVEAIATGATLRDQIKAIYGASARTHARKPAITPFLASIPLEIRRHPDLLPSLAQEGNELIAPLTAMFQKARKRGEIPSGADDLDLVIAFVGAVMGVGLLCYGLSDGPMDKAVDILLAGLDGQFFKENS